MAMLPLQEYQIGIVCALHIELAAVRAMFDVLHGNIGKTESNDHNTYFAGSIRNSSSEEHNIVVASLPAGQDGLAAASAVAKDMVRTFTHLRLGLLVGIGGGIPDLDKGIDIRLGDVVVGLPEGIHPGVVQYDKGKALLRGNFQRKGVLSLPPKPLLTAIQSLRAEHEMRGSRIGECLQMMYDRYPRMARTYACPAADRDILYSSSHKTPVSMHRTPRRTAEPEIYYGTIASGNVVIKDAKLRDKLRTEFGAICVEMEAAGLMNDFPCLVIRGICDYADSHKNDDWHRYAAATAAAFSKELLWHVSVEQVKEESLLQEDIYSLLEQNTALVQEQNDYLRKVDRDRLMAWLSPPTYDQQYQDALSRRSPKTGRWFLDSQVFQEWQSDHFPILLCPGIPGAGKTVMSAITIESLWPARHGYKHLLAFLFCSHTRYSEQSIEALAKSLLRQLVAFDHIAFKEVAKLYTKLQYDKTPLTIEQISEVLVASINRAEKSFFVIDALDECTDLVRARLARFLHNLMSSVNKTGNNKLSAMLTYREGTDLGMSSVTSKILKIEANIGDQKIYLGSRLAELSGASAQIEGVDDKILEKIPIACEGMFLLTTLLFELLRHIRIASEIEHLLSDIVELRNRSPNNVTLLYARVYDTTLARLRRYAPEDFQWATRLIAWVFHATRPLSGDEIREGFALSSGDKLPAEKDKPILSEILSLCIGLIVVNPGTNTLDFVHYTTRVYFSHVAHQLEWLEEGLVDLSKTCIAYLMLVHHQEVYKNQGELHRRKLNPVKGYWHCSVDLNSSIPTDPGSLSLIGTGSQFSWPSDFPLDYHNKSQLSLQLEETMSICPLFTYAVLNWGLHASQVEEECHSSIWQLLSNFECTKMVAECMLHVLREPKYVVCESRVGIGWTSLHLAAYYGLHTIVPRLFPFESSLMQFSGLVGQPLMFEVPLRIAAERGHASTVRQLLRFKKIDVDAHGPGDTAILCAVRGGFDNIVNLLLSHGAKVEPQTIHIASSGGHLEVVNTLLHYGVPIGVYKDTSGTAVHAAVTANHHDVVRLLLAKGADINQEAGKYCTVLQAACATTDSELFVQHLLNHGADVNITGGQFTTALHAAVSRGSIGVVRKLLRYGSTVSIVDSKGRTPLDLAMEQGRHEIADLIRGTRQ